MEPIDQTIASLMKRLKEKQAGLGWEGIEAAGARIFSRKERSHCRVQSFSKGILRVRVDSSSWLYYFMQHKKELLARLTACLEDARDIRFFVGDFKSAPAEAGARRRRRKENLLQPKE